MLRFKLRQLATSNWTSSEAWTYLKLSETGAKQTWPRLWVIGVGIVAGIEDMKGQKSEASHYLWPTWSEWRYSRVLATGQVSVVFGQIEIFSRDSKMCANQHTWFIWNLELSLLLVVVVWKIAEPSFRLRVKLQKWGKTVIEIDRLVKERERERIESEIKNQNWELENEGGKLEWRWGISSKNKK